MLIYMKHSSNLLFRACLNISYSKEGLFKADFNTVNKVISQTYKYKQFIPWCTASQITQFVSNYQNYTTLRISFNKFKNLDYLSHVRIQKKQDQVKVTSLCKSYPLKHLQSVWMIHRLSQVQTNVTYNINFEFSSVIFQLTSNLFLNFMGQQMWDIFYSKCQSEFLSRKKKENNEHSDKCHIKITSKLDTKDNRSVQFIQNELGQYLSRHSKFKQKYLSDALFKQKTDLLYQKLVHTQNIQEKLTFELNNLLAHIN